MCEETVLQCASETRQWAFITPPNSRGLCNHVIRSAMVRTGWQQVAVVYLAMGQLVQQLRQQDPPNRDRRESQYARYAGTYMQDIGLQRWISAQGGMVRGEWWERKVERNGGSREGVEW